MKTVSPTILGIGLIAACLFLAGCVPDELETKFGMNPATHSFEWKNHKDITASDVTIAQTNGTFYGHIGSITSVNNPQAINAQANLNQVTITAYGDSATQLVNALSNAAGQVAGKTVNTAVTGK